MDLTEREQTLLRRWQASDRLSTDATLTPFQRADHARSLAELPRYAAALKIAPLGDLEPLTRKLSDRYSRLVDDPTGVNNYAEAALALSHGRDRRNDSKLWSTSLTPERMASLGCVQRYMVASQAAQASLVPPGKENAVLFTRRTESNNNNADTNANVTEATPVDSDKGMEQNVLPPSPPARLPGPQPLFKKASASEKPPERKFNFTSSAARGSRAVKEQDPEPPEYSRKYPVPPEHSRKYPEPPEHSRNYQEPPEHSRKYPNYQPAAKPAEFTRTDPNLPPRTFPQPQGRSASFPGGRVPSYPGGSYRDRGDPPPLKRPYSEVEPGEGFGDDAVVPTAPAPGGAFKTAREQLVIDQQRKYGGGGRGAGGGRVSTAAYGSSKKSLGTRRGLNSKFVPPVINRDDTDCDDGGRAGGSGALTRRPLTAGGGTNRSGDGWGEEPVDERLRNIEPKMVELIQNEIMDHGPAVAWDDIAGLEFAKKTVYEIIVLPMLRPDIFTGIRAPPRGLLLFGPPGTGKTLIGKCIASQAKSTFFSISASSLTSKWVGEGEKMVRALFAVARINQPAVIFIDEIDSLLSQRSDGEHDASRRIKTEFLVQLDGATTGAEERLLVVGATNRPQEIDEAARRRFVKRLYIPLPESPARQHIIRRLLSQQNHSLSDQQMVDIATKTDGYSGADMANLCSEAALGPIRSLSFSVIENIAADDVRPISFEDFTHALRQVKPSVSTQDLGLYIDWNKQFGSWQM